MNSFSAVLLAAFFLVSANSYTDDLLLAKHVPFSFIAEGKTYAAGDYQFFLSDSATVVRFQGVKGTKENGMVPI